MSAKKKKQANSPLRIVIILILLGLLAYKYQLFDGKLLENIPAIENNEEKPEIRILRGLFACFFFFGGSKSPVRLPGKDSSCLSPSP